MKIQIEQLDLLGSWPRLALREGYHEMRVLVRLGTIPLGQIASRPVRKRFISHDRLRRRIAAELGETLLQTLAQEGLTAGPEALKWFMPNAWARFDMTSASPRDRREYVRERFVFPSGLASPLREWVIESQKRQPSWPMPAVTVAMCTRDRETILEDAIRTLQHLDYADFEILIVNNSADPVPTQEIAKRLGVASVRCLAPGTSHARNIALAHASHGWIAFIDDDCRPEKNWLKELVRPAQDGQCRAVVGQTLPARLENAAEIAVDAYERRTGQRAAGTNMLLHRHFAQMIGGFEADLGRGPRSLGGGEDVDLLNRIRRCGFAVHDAPRALAHHHREVSSRTLRQQILARASGHAIVQLRRGSIFSPIQHVISLTGELRRALAGRSRYPFSLLLLEMKGTLAGPVQYVWSRLARTWRQQARRIGPMPTVIRPALATEPPAPVKRKVAA